MHPFSPRPRVVAALLACVAVVGSVAVLLAGCGRPVAPGAAVEPATPSAQARWPAPGGVAADQLQRDVDAGHQAWLLDPESVATSYAAAVLGWPRVQTSRTGPTTVVVRQADGTGRSALVLEQPVRGGASGIWVVVHADPPPTPDH